MQRPAPSKHQRLGLLDLRQRLHLGEHVRRHRAVDLDQRDGVAARRVAAEVEGGDVDAWPRRAGVPKRPMKPGLSSLVT